MISKLIKRLSFLPAIWNFLNKRLVPTGYEDDTGFHYCWLPARNKPANIE